MTNRKNSSHGFLWFLFGLVVSGVAYVALKKSQEEDDPWADPWEKSSLPLDENSNIEDLSEDL